jgi:hypothetical protein
MSPQKNSNRSRSKERKKSYALSGLRNFSLVRERLQKIIWFVIYQRNICFCNYYQGDER